MRPHRDLLILILSALSLLAVVPDASAQTMEIGIIDFYGLRHVSEADARRLLDFHEGTSIPLSDEKPRLFTSTEARLRTLPNVDAATIELVCCEEGRLIVYVGIQERGAATLRFRPAPRGTVRLPEEVTVAGAAMTTALMAAIERGDNAEDDSQGHAVWHDPAARAQQDLLVAFAAGHRALIRKVLREASDDEQRALAAETIAYVPDKSEVVGNLVAAMRDPSSSVRNNAARALAVFASAESRPVRIPYEPFVALLNSPVWTDRNKALFALFSLADSSDPRLFALLRQRALPSIMEMARWKSEGHAFPALSLLARMDGRSSAEAEALSKRPDRAEVIVELTRK